MKKFECTACGLCCVIAMNPDLPPEWDRGDGFCQYLKDDMSCGIYEGRPMACRVDDSWDDEAERKKIEEVMGVETREEFHQFLTLGCLMLQAEAKERSDVEEQR